MYQKFLSVFHFLFMLFIKTLKASGLFVFNELQLVLSNNVSFCAIKQRFSTNLQQVSV